MFFRTPSFEVICVGSVSKDIFFPTDEGIIIETPEDILSKQKIAFELGGKYRIRDRYEAVGGVAANVAHGLTRLGHTAGCYSNVGQDEIGDWIKDEFKQANVPTQFLYTDVTAKTDLSALIVMTQNGERTIFHNRDANEKLEIVDKKFAHTKWVFLSALNGPWKENLKKILALKQKYGFLLAFNPGQHNLREDAILIREIITHTDVLLLNKDEAIELITNNDRTLSTKQLEDETQLLQILHMWGARIIGMTDGKRGAWSFDGKQYWYCPIYTVHGVVDSTGAGDAFGSGFFAAILESKTIDQGLIYGIANSGSVVGSYGAIDGLLSKEAIEHIQKNIIPQHLQ